MELSDTATTLMATHGRLRANGFRIVSVVGARSALDARVWLGQWCRSNDRQLIVAPSSEPMAAFQSYVARLSTDVPIESLEAARLPVLLLPTAFSEALPVAVGLSAQHNRFPVAIACGLGELVEALLAPSTPLDLVSAALEGLVPISDAERRVLQTVAEGRKLKPFLRGACEGLVYYMLEARAETRGLFAANGRVTGSGGNLSHEVDIVCETAKLVIEIDGPEHNQPRRKLMDARKQADLEGQGYRVRRFSNQQVIDDPVGVWLLIKEQLAGRIETREHT